MSKNWTIREDQIIVSFDGQDGVQSERKDTLLHGPLQEGLEQNLMEAAAVSGAMSSKGLCLAAKSDERSQEELRKQTQYYKPTAPLYLSRRKEDSYSKTSGARTTMINPKTRKKEWEQG